MVDPYVFRATFDSDGIFITDFAVMDFEVADDDVIGTPYFNTNPIKFAVFPFTDDGDIVCIFHINFITEVLEGVIVPSTTIFNFSFVPLLLRAANSSFPVFTVTVLPPSPPVVPPFNVENPC